MSTRFCRFHYNSQQHTDSYGHTQSIAPPRLSIGAPTPRSQTTVIRLKGRRTAHQNLKSPLIEVTQPSISNQWAIGGPPLVLISHPSGMTPDEERFYTENRSTCLSPKLGLDGDAHLSPPVKKKEQRDGALQASPPWKTPSRSPGQQNTNKINEEDIPTTRGLQGPQKGAGEKE